MIAVTITSTGGSMEFNQGDVETDTELWFVSRIDGFWARQAETETMRLFGTDAWIVATSWLLGMGVFTIAGSYVAEGAGQDPNNFADALSDILQAGTVADPLTVDVLGTSREAVCRGFDFDVAGPHEVRFSASFQPTYVTVP
jgi:hypothetical protein